MLIPLFSFFTGGGFLDIGFEGAGFRIVWTNEVNKTFADMYGYGMTALHRATDGRASAAKITNCRSIVRLSAREVKTEAFGRNVPPVYGVIGGPPCPDFSVGGRNAGRHGRHGPLTRVFLSLVCDLKPTFFVMENVPGLCRTRKHRAFLECLIRRVGERGRYAVDLRVLSALELGVPQDRDRLFVVGIQQAFARRELGLTFAVGERGWFPWPKPRYPKAKALPWPQMNPFGARVTAPDRIPLELTVYPLLCSKPNPEDLPNGRDFFVPHSRKFGERSEGDVSNKSFKRLHRYRYSPTAWYGNNEVHLHPWKPRRLSVREALRIQTVPDAYVLPEGAPLGAKFKLIANGVPVLMAQRVAQAVRDFLGCSGGRNR
jgi:DNA (cytosine-5)-methyltransferase 1